MQANFNIVVQSLTGKLLRMAQIRIGPSSYTHRHTETRTHTHTHTTNMNNHIHHTDYLKSKSNGSLLWIYLENAYRQQDTDCHWKGNVLNGQYIYMEDLLKMVACTREIGAYVPTEFAKYEEQELGTLVGPFRRCDSQASKGMCKEPELYLDQPDWLSKI